MVVRKTTTLLLFLGGEALVEGPPVVWKLGNDGGGGQPIVQAPVLEPDIARKRPQRRKSERRQNRQLADRFRPILRFDRSEHWRPLNVPRFFKTTVTLRVCNKDAIPGCWPMVGHTYALGLPAYDKKNSFLDDVQGTRSESSKHRTLREDCGAGGNTYECPRTDSAIYFQVVNRGSRMRYMNYWYFYRFNGVPGGAAFAQFRHESDWEGMTVAVDMNNPRRAEWVGLTAHGHLWKYPSEALRCGYEKVACGEGGAWRTNNNVAAGTHANYPFTCRDKPKGACNQTDGSRDGVKGLPPEAGYDGHTPWELNDRRGTLRPFPRPQDSRWLDFLGNWNEDSSSSIRSPAAPDSGDNYERYGTPWNLAQRTAREEEKGRSNLIIAANGTSSASQSEVVEGDVCADWNGPGVGATVCDPEVLAASMGGDVSLRGGPVVRGSGRPTGSIRGLGQVMGGPLRQGDALRLSGFDKNAVVKVRLTDGRYAGTVSFRNVEVPSGQAAVVSVPPDIRSTTLRLPGGRSVAPTSVAIEKLPRDPRVKLRSIGNRLKVRIAVDSPAVSIDQARTCTSRRLGRVVRLMVRHGRVATRMTRRSGARVVRVRMVPSHSGRGRSVCRNISR